MKQFFKTLIAKIKGFFTKEKVAVEESELRAFLSKVAYRCTDCAITAQRITKSMLMLYDYELSDSSSVFSMQNIDFVNPRGRIEHLFLFKNLDNVDTVKAQRAEDIVYLLSLKEYKEKYSMDEYDLNIEALTSTIEEESVEEVDSLLSTTSVAVTRGTWSN